MMFGRTTLRRWLCPLSVDTSASMQRVWHYSASMGASMRLYPAVWILSRASRQGVEQNEVGAAAFKTTVIDSVEGDPA